MELLGHGASVCVCALPPHHNSIISKCPRCTVGVCVCLRKPPSLTPLLLPPSLPSYSLETFHVYHCPSPLLHHHSLKKKSMTHTDRSKKPMAPQLSRNFFHVSRCILIDRELLHVDFASLSVLFRRFSFALVLLSFAVLCSRAAFRSDFARNFAVVA